MGVLDGVLIYLLGVVAKPPKYKLAQLIEFVMPRIFSYSTIIRLARWKAELLIFVFIARVSLA